MQPTKINADPCGFGYETLTSTNEYLWVPAQVHNTYSVSAMIRFILVVTDPYLRPASENASVPFRSGHPDSEKDRTDLWI